MKEGEKEDLIGINFYELLVKLAAKLDYMANQIKVLDSTPDVPKEEFLTMFKTAIDESNNIIYNRLIDNLYTDPKFKELIISLIKSQFKELSS